MSKLKIEHGASRVRWALLKTTIEESLSNDIDLMCQWSENDRKYVINELLRFAITHTEEFQKYKAELPSGTSGNKSHRESAALTAKPVQGLGPKPSGPPQSTEPRE